MTQHVLFDLDGTLTDSAPGITRCMAHALRAVGARAPALDTLRPFIGSPLREIFSLLIQDANAEMIDDAIAAYVERFDRTGFYENSLFPGVLETLEALRQARCNLYIATAKGQEVAEKVVDYFELRPLFRAVFGVQAARGIMSKQDVLAFGLRDHEIPQSMATMVGDRDRDIDAARCLGIRAIGVSWGYGPLAELSSAHAIVHKPIDLTHLISRAG